MFDRALVEQVINNLYGVFLGFVLSSFYDVEKVDGYYKMEFINNVNWFILALLVGYYLIDWFTTIFLIKRDDEITTYHLMLLVFSNIALCYTILMSINGGINQFLIFGVYSFIVPFWDLLVTADKIKDVNKNTKYSIYFYKWILGMRFIFGFVLCLPISFLMWKGSTEHIDLFYFCYSLVVCIVLLKWARMHIIFNLYKKSEAVII